VVRAGGKFPLVIGPPFMYTRYMAMSTLTVHKKKIGRPATGHDPAVTVRIPAEVLKKIEKWAKANGFSRSAAIAFFVQLGFDTAKAKRARKPKAAANV
jgi:CopG-like RHH_1 or ribbon-helix-helix domain, RHH_5